jgi:hyaluronan synthase
MIFYNINKFIDEKRINAWVAFFFIVYLILIIKFITIKEFSGDWFFAAYGIVVSAYILSRFLFSYFYENFPANGYEPVVTFVIPTKNEEMVIRQTIDRIYAVDYPKEKIEVIAINDGSEDKTLERMNEAKIKYPHMVIVDWKINRGKRAGLAEGTRLAKGEILIFVDSDSFIKKDSIRFLVQSFADPDVAAVAGHAEVYNAEKNIITKMQAVRYYISFRVYKATESIFHTVTCCSGCFSAYRKKFVDEVMDEWMSQKFLGVNCTYGDDRSLTNYLIKNNHKLKYCREAIAYTIVPDTLDKFLKQQLRWKKSWSRECLIASGFIWKRHPVMSISFYISILLPLLAPIVVARALIWYPYHTHRFPYYYIFGLILVSFLYGFYYYAHTGKKLWFYGIIFAWFYTFVLTWQLPYAILTLRDSKWGTR